MKVTQLINNNGNPAANHFIIQCSNGDTVLQSYDSLVAKIDKNGNVTLGPDWDYSNTTLKHLKTFLGTNESKKELQKKIDSGIFTLDDINIQ